MVSNTVYVADKYGHSVSWYRDSNLEAIGYYHHTTAETPISLSIFNDFLYVCYSNELTQFSMSLVDDVARINLNDYIQIPQICCTASNKKNVFVGTLKPSLIVINVDKLRIDQEYLLNPIRYLTDKENRYPYLQDMKALEELIFCLFTGSPSPLQMFTLKGELISSLLTEDQIVGAYHFNVFLNPVTKQPMLYITDFWDNTIKAFDMKGQFIETFSERGFGLGQIFHPTGIFIEESGIITVCDMKEDNCLQRL